MMLELGKEKTKNNNNEKQEEHPLQDILEEEDSHDLFRILYSTSAFSQRPQLPSWVPDWSVDFNALPLWPVNLWKLED